MTPNELTLSWMLWLCVGWLIGYRCHALKVRDDLARKELDEAVDQLLARVAVRCIERPKNLRCN